MAHMSGQAMLNHDRMVNVRSTADIRPALKDGKIAERGTHAQLLDQRGIYFGMVQDQYRDFLNISGQKAGEA